MAKQKVIGVMTALVLHLVLPGKVIVDVLLQVTLVMNVMTVLESPMEQLFMMIAVFVVVITLHVQIVLVYQMELLV